MINGVYLKPLRIHPDDRGWLVETLRADDPFFGGFGQSVVTLTYPGVIKAFHYHQEQDDYWVVLRGMAQVVLYDLREGSLTQGETNVFYLGEQNMQLLIVPRGVAHGYRVLGTEPVLLLYHVTRPYHPDHPDEFRIPFDDPRIGFDWTTKNR
ncbi:MAG: dTDP-4-dehydrorhamnose 3,5-epimerase family protein [Armatimonadetes bacterium]|nr:dTDP-4-dehydrorhamnose 3,5-epimerase family protein [Armatimonadota bacterium]